MVTWDISSKAPWRRFLQINDVKTRIRLQSPNRPVQRCLLEHAYWTLFSIQSVTASSSDRTFWRETETDTSTNRGSVLLAQLLEQRAEHFQGDQWSQVSRALWEEDEDVMATDLLHDLGIGHGVAFPSFAFGWFWIDDQIRPNANG